MTTKQAALDKIKSLITRFEDQYESYMNSEYNETKTRRDFIDPFFKALGWDIDNEAGYAEAYREVIHEDKVKVHGSTEAPDYSFRLVGGKRLFFVEAKKPSISVKNDIHPSYQVRRYGWSAKLPISIITDFEEFSIYDCTKKPKPEDKAAVARIKYLSFRDYIKEFDFIWDTFSKEQVLKGSFDKFLLSDTHKKGTATVDKDFLESLDRWRTYLAVNISWNNRTLDEDEINFIVQQTIDRIIFLRIAEDRSVEPYGTLKHAVKQGNLYQNLFELFQRADEKYNSGLFDFKKDKINRNVVIENKIIRTIINELYYPECPYEFSVLSVEILGSAYEQFLGKVIRITPAHHAKIEEKPEVRKAGGVYYTPQYIVDYIVKNTVGKLIEGKTPKEISKIKILDPACGSGSFLIGAFQYLLDYHKDYYSENGKPSIGKKDNPLTPDGHLTTAEKKRILLNNIFGVDLDVNAVEVTKLSLLIKCLEGETEASIKQQLHIWNERVLPTLENNIKAGNTLIEVDFYDSQLDFGFDKKIKPFNWRNEFSDIIRNGGFNIILGNPPYFSLDIVSSEQKDYFAKKYSQIFTRQSNIYFFFIAKAKEILIKDGLLCFINERYYFNSKNAERFRKFVLDNYTITQIVDFQNIQIFDGVNTLTVINTFKNSSDKNNVEIILFNQSVRKLDEYKIAKSSLSENFSIKQGKIDPADWTFSKENITKLKSKFKNLPTLDKIVDMGQGITAGKNEVFIVDKQTIKDFNLEHKILKKYIKTRDIQRYHIQYRDLYLILTLEDTIIENYPNIIDYLSNFRKDLEKRYEFKTGKGKWYSVSVPRNLNLLKCMEKIFTPLYAKGNKFALDDSGPNGNFYILTDTYVLTKKIEIDFKYLLALLNSKLLTYYNSKFGKLKRDGYYEYSRNTLSRFPIKLVDQNNPKEAEKAEEIIKLVDQIIILKKQLAAETLQSNISQIESKLDYLEKKVDQNIYDLYDLTEDQINMIDS